MIPLINYPFDYLAGVIGAGRDELKLIFSFLLSYPLAGILKRLPDATRTHKDLFIIGVSLFYLVGLFDLWGGIRTLFISAAGAYAIAKYIQGPYMPWVGFVFVMGHMLYSHTYRQMRPVDGAVDITGAQMVLVMKLTAFCWNVHDGRLPESELTELQKNRALKDLPPILDFTSYVLFFPSLFAGPSFDYAEYRRWLDTSMFDVDIPVKDGKPGATRRKRKIPRSSRPAAIKAIYGLIWIAAFVKLTGIYNEEFAIGDGFKQYSFLRKVWWLYMFAFTARTKYYGVWLLTEGACILTGLGFNGIDETKKPKWNRVTNVDPYELESSQNVRAYLEAWNKNTNKWLKNYVYLRVTPKGKKPGFRSSLATFTTSALWHGVAPGYYLTFISAAFMQTIGKYFRRNVRPFFLTPEQSGPGPYKHAYDVFGWVATQFGFSYIVVPFLVLFMDPSLIIWARVKFFGHILIALTMAFFNSPAKAILTKKLKARAGKAKIHRSASQDELRPPTLGLSENGLELLEEEIKAEVEEFKKRRGSFGQLRARKGN